MRPKLHLFAHGFQKHIYIDLGSQPAPTVCGTGFGSFKWWVEGDGVSGHKEKRTDGRPRMTIRNRTTGGTDEVDLGHSPAPSIMAQGIGGVSHGQYEVHFCQKDNRTGKVKKKNISREPSTTICAQGTGDSFASEYWLEVGAERCRSMGKPPYRVPSMAEIAKIPWNGLKVASTFSGAGGSCLGYRLAGFRVVWANEFVPAAQDTYEANKDPGCVLDRRDIKDVKPEEVLEATGLKVGELDLLDGSPPCQAFSTAGKREKGWGTDRKYEHGASQRNEDLFYEYIRLLRGLKPRAFVAENVSGLVKGVAKGYFLDILAKLKESGYVVQAAVLDAKWLGVPQSRQRVIFVGVREDLDLKPAFPKPLKYLYSVTDACPWIGSARYDTQGNWDAFDFTGRPAPAIIAGRSSSHTVKGKVKRGGDNSGHYSVATGIQQEGWSDDRHDASVDQPSPAITAKHRHKLKLVAPQARRSSKIDPAPTVLGCSSGYSDISVGQRRKFTILEVKRICSFPDDFVLTGTYGQQWERMGNSVPPLMMRAIASAMVPVLQESKKVHI